MTRWVPRKIQPEVMDAIQKKDRSTDVFYITSAGGEGKTIFLRQIGEEMGIEGGTGSSKQQGSKNGIGPGQYWSGILDLYHSEINTSSGLEGALIASLETFGEFQRFRERREHWTTRREAGLVGPELETERTQMAEVFGDCFNAVTRWTRVVVAIDTTERMQYELDEVQALCGLESESTTVRAWLLDQLRRWQNCVVLLVGRPEGKLDPVLAETLTGLAGVHYKALTLKPFDLDEAMLYFETRKPDSQALAAVDAAFLRRLWEVTQGRPIRLELAVEVIEHALGFDRFRQQIQKGPDDKIQEIIDRLLIEHVMSGETDPCLRQVLRYLAVARKGLDAALLNHLRGWDREECRRRLEAVTGRSFVKRHAGEERLFLHDEMYLLCDRHLLEPAEVQELSKRIVDWYDEATEKETDAKKHQDLQVNSTAYRLRADPIEGYHWYVRRAASAIRAAEVGFELRLRSEVLSFLKGSSPIDRTLVTAVSQLMTEYRCDSAANWVKRLTVRGETERAVQVAETVRRARPPLCPEGTPGTDLAWAELDVYDAQALIYTARAPQAVERLRQVIARLEGSSRPDELAGQDPTSYAGWRRNQILGRAHNNLGYAYWVHLGCYQAALAQFRAALPYFQASAQEEELANTNDNMGRVYALLRHPTRAETFVNEGLSLRRKLDRTYRIGLSLNSKAIVYLEFGQPYPARRLAEEALSIFDGLGTQRGVGLACITLGHALRDLGSTWGEGLYPFSECDQLLRQGAGYLDRAIRVFTDVVQEPLRLVEALNEQGCVHRARSALQLDQGSGLRIARAIALDAIDYLDRSIDLAERLELWLQFADSCEDLARVYFQMGEYANARSALERAEANIPDEYKLKEGRGWSRIADEDKIEEFWLQLGKIELLRGNLAFDEGASEQPSEMSARLGEAVHHYLLSTAYFEHFSDRAVGLGETFIQMHERLKKCRPDELQRLSDTIPQLTCRYSINMDRFNRFFTDTLGSAIHWPAEE